MLVGTNQNADLLLAFVGIHKECIPRYRDIWTDGKTIKVFARIGCGNKAQYQYFYDKLPNIENFVSVCDDPYDETYAHVEFRPLAVPNLTPETVLAMLDALKTEPPMVKFSKLLDKVKAGDENDPDVKRAMNVGLAIFGQIAEATKAGGDHRGVVSDERGNTVNIISVAPGGGGISLSDNEKR